MEPRPRGDLDSLTAPPTPAPASDSDLLIPSWWEPGGSRDPNSANQRSPFLRRRDWLRGGHVTKAGPIRVRAGTWAGGAGAEMLLFPAWGCWGDSSPRSHCGVRTRQPGVGPALPGQRPVGEVWPLGEFWNNRVRFRFPATVTVHPLCTHLQARAVGVSGATSRLLSFDLRVPPPGCFIPALLRWDPDRCPLLAPAWPRDTPFSRGHPSHLTHHHQSHQSGP